MKQIRKGKKLKQVPAKEGGSAKPGEEEQVDNADLAKILARRVPVGVSDSEDEHTASDGEGWGSEEE